MNSLTVQQSRVGTLVVLDHFKQRGDAKPHGEKVIQAALEDGYQGPIAAFERESGVNGAELLRTRRQIEAPLSSKEEFLEQLREYVVYREAGMVRGANQDLRKLLEGGWESCAVNISMGGCKVAAVDGLADLWSKKDGSSHLYQNLLTVFDLGQEIAEGEKGWGTQYIKVREKVAEYVSNTLDQSPELAGSKTEYRGLVEKLADKKVSVVVSAGNDGRAHGCRVPKAADAFDNHLSDPKVLTVGTQEEYSNPSANVRILADGKLRTGGQGTSYASPRVAARAAELHGLYPQASNQEIDSMLLAEARPADCGPPVLSRSLLNWGEPGTVGL
ncbi:MAG: S8 family serine peptidase [Vulcanimicrobiota bacterium]